MNAALKAELFKQRTTRTAASLLAALLTLVLFVVSLHGFGLAAAAYRTDTDQLNNLFAWGEVMGALFAGLLGAMSITTEIRHGTIRPTLLANPIRSQVVMAKMWSSLLIGTGFGAAASGVAVVVGLTALKSRSIAVQPDAGDFALLILGGAAAAGLWAVIGVGVGAIVRSQVPALIGITVWLLFVENLLVGDIAGVGDVGRLMPGAAAKALSGQDPAALVAPVAGLALLIGYAIVAGFAGSISTSRRDLV